MQTKPKQNTKMKSKSNQYNEYMNLRTAHICALCTIVVHNTAQSSSDCLPSKPPAIIIAQKVSTGRGTASHVDW